MFYVGLQGWTKQRDTFWATCVLQKFNNFKQKRIFWTHFMYSEVLSRLAGVPKANGIWREILHAFLEAVVGCKKGSPSPQLRDGGAFTPMGAWPLLTLWFLSSNCISAKTRKCFGMKSGGVQRNGTPETLRFRPKTQKCSIQNYEYITNSGKEPPPPRRGPNDASAVGYCGRGGLGGGGW